MTPEQQQQFNQELQLVVAVAAQIYPGIKDHQEAVNTAIFIIRDAESKLKDFYEPEPAKAPTPETKPEPPVPAPVQPRPSRKMVEESITATSQVILAKKLKTQDELLAMVAAYGAKNKSQLNDEQALKLLEQLKAILNQGEK